MKKKIGYVIRLHGVLNRYAYGKAFKSARVFPTRLCARLDKNWGKKCNPSYTKSQEIYQVELNSKGRPKRIIKKVR